jgi:KRAB domain-containing zinc finger protein
LRLQNKDGMHASDKHIKCDLSDKGFRQSGDLQRHINRTHTGDKTYKCDICDKVFQ